MTESELRELRHLRGLFVGQLDENELELFERGVEEGVAWRKYDGASGFLGLAKVSLLVETWS